jgi:hypothetical protein
MEAVAEDGCQLLQLPYFRWHWVVFDPMHTVGGVVAEVVWETLHDPKWSQKVQACERWLGRWGEGPPAQLDAHETGILHTALEDMAASFPGRGGLGRLLTLISPGESSKTHAFFLLGGPVGLYALAKVLKSVGPGSSKGMVIEVLMQVLRAVHVLWAKEVHCDSLPFMKAVVIEAVCAVEACLPVSERTMKLHEFALLPDCIAQWGECWSCAVDQLGEH